MCHKSALTQTKIAINSRGVSHDTMIHNSWYLANAKFESLVVLWTPSFSGICPPAFSVCFKAEVLNLFDPTVVPWWL